MYILSLLLSRSAGSARSSLSEQRASSGIRSLEILAWMSLAALTAQAADPTDFNGDGTPDFVFRNRITGRSQVWPMQNLDLKPGSSPMDIVYRSNPNMIVENPPADGISPDDWWRIAGTGDVNRDSIPDLIWENRSTRQLAVWFMGGPANQPQKHQLLSAALCDVTYAEGYRLVGTADFDGDGVTDLLWENQEYPGVPVGDKAIWFMNPDFTFDTGRRLHPLVPITPPGYRTVAIGDFGNPEAGATGVPDGKVDLILRHSTEQYVQIWVLDRTDRTIRLIRGEFVADGQGNARIVEAPWKILGTANYGGYADQNGEYNDLLFRRDDFCDMVAWHLRGREIRSVQMAGPTASIDLPFGPSSSALHSSWRTFYNQQWKLAGQEPEDPTFRVSGVPDVIESRLKPVLTPDGYTLEWDLAPTAGPLYPEEWSYHVYFKRTEEAKWRPLQSLVQQADDYDPPVSIQGTTLGGTKIDPGQRYDFHVLMTYVNPNNQRQEGSVVRMTSAAVSARPIEDRGGILLLIDETLEAANPGKMAQLISTLSDTLERDGYSSIHVERAPRHVEDYTAAGFKEHNYDALFDAPGREGIKTIVDRAIDRGARTLLIIGHVVVPFSGYHNPDGHGIRSGPADLFYGDRDGVWGNTAGPAAAPTDPRVSPEEYQFATEDGKFSRNFIPTNSFGVYNGLEMAVGRVDFARMPSFGTGGANNMPSDLEAEMDLIVRYFEKTRRFRENNPSAPYPLPDRASVWNYLGNRPNFQVETLRKVLKLSAQPIVSGDSLMQVDAPYLIGYASGLKDHPDGYMVYGLGGRPRLWHRGTDLLEPDRIPKIGFHFIRASFEWNWNLPNSYMKALLLSPDYGLAAIWDMGAWRTDSLGLGENLGRVQIHNVQTWLTYRNAFGDRLTSSGLEDVSFFSILGDPTLRLRYLSPPIGPVKLLGTRLTWRASPEPDHEGYLVHYKTASGFKRVEACLNGPVKSNGVQLNASKPEASASTYLVRTVKTISTGAGQYQELSQGLIFRR